NLGSLLQDCLQRPEEATQAYLECLKREPDDAFAHANLAYQSLASGVQEADRYLEAALAKLPAHGANLLHAFAALARDNFGAATAAFAEALESAHPELYSNYFHDILRLLRLAAARNYGEKLLAWFDLSGHADRNWPLRAAFDAYLHGEARLGDVNPEVGSAARRIFRALGPLPAPATPAPGAAKRAARKTKAS
ncbi:MAG: hypothetical protein JNM98_07360, partial [Rhodocyclaceae bacterium]|nr:hypothetical protein [Rhodocyclaceae bacterium]